MHQAIDAHQIYNSMERLRSFKIKFLAAKLPLGPSFLKTVFELRTTGSPATTASTTSLARSWRSVTSRSPIRSPRRSRTTTSRSGQPASPGPRATTDWWQSSDAGATTQVRLPGADSVKADTPEKTTKAGNCWRDSNLKHSVQATTFLSLLEMIFDINSFGAVVAA